MSVVVGIKSYCATINLFIDNINLVCIEYILKYKVASKKSVVGVLQQVMFYLLKTKKVMTDFLNYESSFGYTYKRSV